MAWGYKLSGVRTDVLIAIVKWEILIEKSFPPNRQSAKASSKPLLLIKGGGGVYHTLQGDNSL
jgi:hypothetical protein